MCKFQIHITSLQDENDNAKKMHLEVYGIPISVPLSQEEDDESYSEKLASFQILNHKSFMLNVYRAPNSDGVCERAKKQQKQHTLAKVVKSTPVLESTDEKVKENEKGKEKVVQMLHVNKEPEDHKSHQDVHTTLIPKTVKSIDVDGEETRIVTEKYPCGIKNCEIVPNTIQSVNTNVNLNYGRPLQTVIVNLDDWKPNQTFKFCVNTRNDAQVPSEIVLVPFEDKIDTGKREDDNNVTVIKTDNTQTTEKTNDNSGNNENTETDIKSMESDEPMKMRILVSNSVILTIEGSMKRMKAPEINNNHGISSTKALLARRHCASLSEWGWGSSTALTDEGIPLVPTRKEIIQELIRERLRSLKMREVDCNKFLKTRENDFVQHRSLAVKIPLATRPEVTIPSPSSEDPESQDASKSIPVSLSFEIQARYQTLVHHAEHLSKIVNSACVSAIEGSIYFILPHISLSPIGTKLNHVGPSLVDDWLDVIYTAAFQLKPSDPSHVQILVEREMKQVTKAAEELLKDSKKTLSKCRKLNEIVRKKYRKVGLKKLAKQTEEKESSTSNTKSDKKKSSKSNNDDNNEEEEDDGRSRSISLSTTRKGKDIGSTFPLNKADVGYSGFIQKMGVSASKLYPNHVYIAVGKYGVLLKKNMRDSWSQFDNLNYPERRVIFLGLMEHMQETIKAVTGSIRRIQELYIDGYPANVHSHLKIVFQLIGDINHGFDLPPVMKKNVLKQGALIAESFQRLVTVVHEIYSMAKTTYAKFHATYYDPDDAQRFKVKKDIKATKVQLIIPFSAIGTDKLTTLKFRSEDSKEQQTTAETKEAVKPSKSELPFFDKINLF